MTVIVVIVSFSWDNSKDWIVIIRWASWRYWKPSTGIWGLDWQQAIRYLLPVLLAGWRHPYRKKHPKRKANPTSSENKNFRLPN